MHHRSEVDQGNRIGEWTQHDAQGDLWTTTHRPDDDNEGTLRLGGDHTRGSRAGAADERHRVRHAGSDQRHHRRVAAGRGRLPGRLGSRLRGDPPDLRRRRSRVAGNVRVAGGQLRVQGGAERRVGRELRPPRRTGRRKRPLEPADGRQRQVLLRPRDALGHRQPQLGDRGRRRRFPVRARLPRRLGSWLSPVVARGP